jgi:hypothetical protein
MVQFKIMDRAATRSGNLKNSMSTTDCLTLFLLLWVAGAGGVFGTLT